jgi:hypothetical protein
MDAVVTTAPPPARSRRHCERREAIQPHRRGSMDCFVATLLAMTEN